jgi:hypothetical protein
MTVLREDWDAALEGKRRIIFVTGDSGLERALSRKLS